MFKKKNQALKAGLLLFSTVAVSFAATGDPYTWPSYSPTIYYNWKEQNGNVSMPTKDADDCSGVVGTQDSGWWCFKWGSTKNSLVTSNAISPMLARLNKDFAYFRDTMGWPPDSRILDGYRSAVYLYGSSLCTDDTTNTALGGWQSWVGDGPIILASYYPVYSFDPSYPNSDTAYQRGAMVHEGIHCILSSLPGCQKACWFHEGGNTWLQQEALAQQTGDYSGPMGELNGAAFLAPFMPIECYSGWLQDGTFGGPCAEGVNKYSGSTQLCTWRKFLGGTQYGNIFPVFLGNVLGHGSIPWIWNYCEGTVLEGIADTIGDTQIRRLITEYRAKQALIDFKKWSDACQVVLDYYFGTDIDPEGSSISMTNYVSSCPTWKASCYAKTTKSNDTLIPNDTTLPGWSGANQIPLKITSGSTMATVTFKPIGKNMKCLLCYRATDGSAIYSTPVDSGTCSLSLDKTPANSVIFAVVCNTDYVFTTDTSIRTKKYDYRLQLGTGIKDTADIYTRWYDVTRIDDTSDATTGAKKIKTSSYTANKLNGPQVSLNRQVMDISYRVSSDGNVVISMYTLSGVLIKNFMCGSKSVGNYSEKFDLSELKLSTGSYLVVVKTKSGYASRVVSAIADKNL